MKAKNEILKAIEEKADKESQLRLQRNTIIMDILNRIGRYLSKDFIQIKEFDIDANFDNFCELFEYFVNLCDHNPEKRISVHLISIILLTIEELDQKYQNLINNIMKIVLSDNFLDDEKEMFNLMNQIIENDLKLCMNKEKYTYINNCLKLFGMNIINLLDTMIFIFPEDNNEQLLINTIKNLRERFPKLIISNSVDDSLKIKNADYINCLNQLLDIFFSDDDDEDLKTIVFEKNKFFMRNPTNDELMKHFNEDSPQRKEKKPKNHGNGQDTSKQIHNGNNAPKIQTTLSLESLDYNQLNPVELLLLNELLKTNEQIEKLKNDNMNSKIRIGILESDLKKIKIRSLYKGIIDIFAFIFEIDLNDYYYNKLNTIISKLDNSSYGEKVEDLKNFLLDIYSYLKNGNYLALNTEENAGPLDMIFSLLKKDRKKDYPTIKPILESLSFDETLKYALNNYYSLNDKSKLIKNIKFQLKDLQNKLNN